MKDSVNNNINVILVVILSILALVFASCSKDNVFGDEEDWIKSTPTDTTTKTPTDDPEEDGIKWETIVSKSFGYNQETGKWPSTLTFECTNGKDTTFTVYCPMTSTISAPAEKIVEATAAATRFLNLDAKVNLDSTSWYSEGDEFYSRTITRRQIVHLNNYDAEIVSTHVEYKMIRGGKEILFLHGNEGAPSLVDDGNVDGGTKERFGKNYTVEVSNLKMDHHLHGLYHEDLVSSTNILREKEEEEEPTADYEIPGLERFLSASRVWNEDERHYCDVYTFECSETYFFVVVNFIYDKDKDKEERTSTITKTVAKSSVVYNEKYSSEVQGCAVYDHGNYLPAIYSWNSTGFIVAGGHSDGTVVSQDIYDTDAVNRGIKNMKKENDAKPTPIIYQRSCTVGNNGVWTIIGKTSGHTVSFTVKSK